MNRPVSHVLVLLLCFAATKDTKPREVWVRTIEPRLSANANWKPCCDVPDQILIKCDDPITTHTSALRALSRQPHCSQPVIAELERLARTDSGALSDLAAAHYARGDFLSAHDAALSAVEAAPRLAIARFNLALAEEKLGLFDNAKSSWGAYLDIDGSSPWAAEARRHRNQLESHVDGSTRWLRNRPALAAALGARDRVTIAQLIAPFPTTAERYLLDELLPAWAENPTPQRLGEARALAEAIATQFGDPFAVDVVDTLRHPKDLDELREGHIAFGHARRAETTLDPATARRLYTNASRLLLRGGSPLTYLAKLGAAQYDDNVTIAKLEQTPAMKRYPHLQARIRMSKANLFYWNSLYPESLDEYAECARIFEGLNDLEYVGTARIRRIGILRVIGQSDLAWRESFEIRRYDVNIAQLRNRHLYFGETARAALTAGHPRVALAYQNKAVEASQKLTAAESPDNVAFVRSLQAKHLAIALRERAAISLLLRNDTQAKRDIEEAHNYAIEEKDRVARRALEARLAEVRAQGQMRNDPQGAVVELTRALDASGHEEYRTFRASLFVQRAEANRLAGDNDAADDDLARALAVLHEEEAAILGTRARGANEPLWTGYFSRFQKTYRDLIRQKIDRRDKKKAEEAFAYVERARAFEPLNLIGHRASESITLAQIQAVLPQGTFLIEYCVLEDRTYAFVIARDRFEVIKLDVPESDINRWSAALQNAAKHDDANAFEAGLRAPFEELVAEPLAAIAQMPHGARPARIVFIPDGALHALPMTALRDAKRYVIEIAPIEFAGSAALYYISLLRDAGLPKTDPFVFAIGDPEIDRELLRILGITQLQRARPEVEAIHALYAPHAEKRLGPDATAAELFRLGRRSSVVHIAAHGFANAEVPSQSMLILAKSAQHNGVITALELLERIELDRTRLVVMSACSSAGGVAIGPEGVAPLVRPLLAAGVPAVIGTLWNVDDATAETLMVSFHRHYKEGRDAATALQAAQVNLLRKSRVLGSALVWSSFEVIGHASSPFEPTQQ